MKHFAITCILMAVASLCFAQDAANLTQLIKPGTKLIYSVESGDIKYPFTVTIKDPKTGSFDWTMGKPVNKSGSVTQTLKGLQDANVLYNYFNNGPMKLGDRTTSVWLSQKLANHFNNGTGDKPIPVYAYGAGKPPLEMGTYTDDIPVEIKVNGVTKTLNVGLVKPLVKSGRDYVPAVRNEFIHYYCDLNMPIIVDMVLDFSISLQEIITK